MFIENRFKVGAFANKYPITINFDALRELNCNAGWLNLKNTL